VRDGIQRLAAAGALVITPNREVRVPDLTRSEFEDIYEIRMNLEGLAAAKAAANMTAEVLADIEGIFTRLKRMSSAADVETLLSSNIDFHFGIYTEARSKHLLSFIEELWLRIGPLMILPIAFDEKDRDAYIRRFLGDDGLHRQLLDRLAANDGDGARAAICAIVEQAAGWYRSHYQFVAEP
jgi:DNA-binding GntR family transcriptional regulator